jgi:hypothetical protein
MVLIRILLLSLLQASTPEQLIEKLESDRIEERQDATLQLERMGAKALPALETALKTASGESKQRIESVLQSIADTMAMSVLAKIEENLHDARTIRIRYSSESTFTSADGTVGLQSKGMILLKDGDKFALTEEELSLTDDKNKSKTRKFQFVSNGKQMSLSLPMLDSKVRETPAGICRFVACCLPRLGAFGAQDILRISYLGDGAEQRTNDPRNIYKLSDVKSTGRDGQMSTLTFMIAGNITKAVSIKVKLWYNPESRMLIKRRQETKSTNGDQTATVIEVYDEFVLNRDIPDDDFRLPEKK